MRRGLHHGISLETSVSDFSGRRQARSVVGDRRRRRNLHFGIVQRPAIRHAAQGAKERRQIGQARNFRRTDSRSRGTRPWWCDHGCSAAETESRVDYSGAWRYRHVGQRILLRRWHRDRCLRPPGWHPNPHPANARQAQPASTRFPHQQRQCLPQPPQGMATSLPWRRDEEPAQLPWLAPYSGGLGPKDHARGFYLWSDRIRPISTINAIRAYNFDARTDDASKAVTAITWIKAPKSNSAMANPGVYCLRTTLTEPDDATLWRIYAMLTNLEAVFRSLKTDLGLRPVYHQIERRVEGHLFISVLAYYVVHTLRLRLKAKGINEAWETTRNTLSSQVRITTTLQRRDGRTVHVRKASRPEPRQQQIPTALNLSANPGGTRQIIV